MVKEPKNITMDTRLMLLLHGHLGNEKVMWILTKPIPENYILLAPRAPVKMGQNQYSWHEITPQWPDLETYQSITEKLLTQADLYVEENNLEINQYDVMGFSQGAAASYAVAMHYPHLVQGIAGLVGFLPMDCDDIAAAEPLAGMPIFMAVGKRDERIPYERSLACAHTLHMAGADVDYHEYDMRHRLNADAMRDLKTWWQTQAEATAERRS